MDSKLNFYTKYLKYKNKHRYRKETLRRYHLGGSTDPTDPTDPTCVTLCFSKLIRELYTNYVSEHLGKSLKEFLGNRNLYKDVLISSPPLSINRDIRLISKKDTSETVHYYQITPNSSLFDLEHALNEEFENYGATLKVMHKTGLKVSLPHPTFEFRLKTEEAPSSELDTTKIGISHLNKILEKCGKKNIDFWEKMIRLNILDMKALENFRSAWFPSAPHPEEMYRCDMCNELKQEPLLDTNVMICRACWDGIIDYKSTSLSLCFTKLIKQFYREYASEKLGKSLKEFLGKRNPEDMLISSPPLSINRNIILIRKDDISGTVRKLKTFLPNTSIHDIDLILYKFFKDYGIHLNSVRIFSARNQQPPFSIHTPTYELRLETDDAPPHIDNRHRGPRYQPIAPFPDPGPAPRHRIIAPLPGPGPAPHHRIIAPLPGPGPAPRHRIIAPLPGPGPAPHHRIIAPSHHRTVAPSSELDAAKRGISVLNKIIEKCNTKNIAFWDQVGRLNILEEVIKKF
jgi:hypothetical protein